MIDGARNPLKAFIDEARKRNGEDTRIDKKNGNFEQMKRIAALKKKGVFVRNDILADFVGWCMRKDIKYVCAFMVGALQA